MENFGGYRRISTPVSSSGSLFYVESTGVDSVKPLREKGDLRGVHPYMKSLSRRQFTKVAAASAAYSLIPGRVMGANKKVNGQATFGRLAGISVGAGIGHDCGAGTNLDMYR